MRGDFAKMESVGCNVYKEGGIMLVTLPEEGFERLVYCQRPGKKTWVHKDFRK